MAKKKNISKTTTTEKPEKVKENPDLREHLSRNKIKSTKSTSSHNHGKSPPKKSKNRQVIKRNRKRTKDQQFNAQ